VLTDASDLALTPEDPTQTIHFKIAVATNRLLAYTLSDYREEKREQLAEQAGSDDPARRVMYLWEVGADWLCLGIVALVGMPVFGLPARALLGDWPGAVVVSACAGVSFFCVSGTANMLWRWFWYLPQARRRARKNGVGSARFAAAMRGASPRDSSLIFQSAIGVVAFAIAMVTLL
jgi:hypothetical protein